jgi:ribosomal protein S18 acetylase RimI-like enzyme
MRTFVPSLDEQRRALAALDPHRNTWLRGDFARGGLHLLAAEDGTLLGIDDGGNGQLSDPSTAPAAIALSLAHANCISGPIVAMDTARGPAPAMDAFISARSDAARWARTFESFEMALLAEPKIASVPGCMLPGTDVSGPFDAWRDGFTRECFPRGGVPPAVAPDCLFVWVDGVPRAMAGALSMGNETVRVVTVYTDPAARGKGYAGALVHSISEQARRRGRNVVTLDVAVDNTAARRAYHRAGFRELCQTSTWRKAQPA